MKRLMLAAASLAVLGCGDQPPTSGGVGVIRGTVSTPSIEGQVVPFAHAVVSAYRMAADPPPGRILRTTAPFAAGLSDAEGRYVIGSLPTGVYAVIAADPAFVRRYSVGHSAQVVGGGEARVDLLMLVDTTTGGGVDTSGVDTTGAPSGPVTRVVISPATQTISVGDSAGAIAMTYNAQSQVLDGRTVTWTIGDSSIVSVTQAAYSFILLRGARSGTATLAATSEGVSGTAMVTVR